MKRILIIGASGFVGSHLAVQLRGRHLLYGTRHRHPLQVDGVTPLPLTLHPPPRWEALLRAVRPEVVLYCAGIAGARDCYGDPMGALLLNAEAPVRLASLLEESGTLMIYFSSARVFAGDRGEYSEEDPRGGLSIYGKTLVQAERSLETHPNVRILRTGPLFGWGAYGQRSLLNRILRRLRGTEPLPVVADEHRSFCSILDLRRAVEQIVEKPEAFPATHYHLSCGGRQSHYDFATAVAEIFEMPTERLVPVTGREFARQAGTPYAPAENLTLASALWKRHGGWRPMALHAALTRLRDLARRGQQ